MKQVKMWIDGAADTKCGGYCAILLYVDQTGKEHRKVIKGFTAEKTTSNRMELTALYNGLRALKEPLKLEVYSNNGYVINTLNKDSITKWITNGWKTKKGEPVKYISLWQDIYMILKKHHCSYVWIKPDINDSLNDECEFVSKSMSKHALNYNVIDYS